MDEITNKALTIGVAIFITIAITSGLLIVIDQIKNIYGQVYRTDISLQSSFSEFDAYDNIEKTGIEIINAIKKYKDNPAVIVQLSNTSGIYATYSGASDVKKNNWGKYTEYVNYVQTGDEAGLKSFLTQIGTYKYTSSISVDNATGRMIITFKQ